MPFTQLKLAAISANAVGVRFRPNKDICFTSSLQYDSTRPCVNRTAPRGKSTWNWVSLLMAYYEARYLGSHTYRSGGKACRYTSVPRCHQWPGVSEYGGLSASIFMPGWEFLSVLENVILGEERVEKRQWPRLVLELAREIGPGKKNTSFGAILCVVWESFRLVFATGSWNTFKSAIYRVCSFLILDEPNGVCNRKKHRDHLSVFLKLLKRAGRLHLKVVLY